MADSLFNVRPQDTPWPDSVTVVADTPHFRYIMAQSARTEAIQALERAKEYANNTSSSDRVHQWVAIANGWINLANATEMNLDPIDYQRRSEPRDA